MLLATLWANASPLCLGLRALRERAEGPQQGSAVLRASGGLAQADGADTGVFGVSPPVLAACDPLAPAAHACMACVFADKPPWTGSDCSADLPTATAADMAAAAHGAVR